MNDDTQTLTIKSMPGLKPVEASLCLTIAWHPNIHIIGAQSILTNSTEVSRLKPAFEMPGRPSFQLNDRYISRSGFRIATKGSCIVIERYNSTQDIYINEHPLQDQIELDQADIEAGVAIMIESRIALVLHYREAAVSESIATYSIAGVSAKVIKLRNQITRSAIGNFNVLITGETGSGKELVATGIHDASNRSTHPYIAINAATLPGDLGASELFGATKGAFTGAHSDRKGYFGSAEGGTLFLDEIGDADRDIQVGLLRAIENHEITPVGAGKPVPVDVRVIAATDTKLHEAIEEKRFSPALYQRLAQLHIEVPSLRERKEDIGLLLSRFLQEGFARNGLLAEKIAESNAMETIAPFAFALIRYSWPGNVRQLRAVAQKALIDASFDGYFSIPESIANEAPAPRAQAKPKVKPSTLSDEQVRDTLARYEYNYLKSAESLGISRAALYKLVQSKGLATLAKDIDEQTINDALAAYGSISKSAEALKINEKSLAQRIKELDL